jgi:hypothetical protein
MEVKALNLKLSLIQESSYNNYVVRLNRVQQVTGQNLEWIMKNPIDTIKYVKLKISTNPRTLAGYIAPICKLFQVHPRFQKLNDQHYATWQKYLKHYRKVDIEQTKKSELSPKQEKNAVGWQSVHEKYCELKDAPELATKFKIQQFHLLLSLFLNMHAKRADLGNVRIYERDPKSTTHNYIYLKPKPFLILNKYKTAKVRGAIKEPLNETLVADIKKSLERFPREYLILGSQKMEPYTKNNSYSQYVKRAFIKHFGRGMGVGLWRIIFITANTDFNETSYGDLEVAAHYKGHSVQQEFLAYRKKPSEKTKDIFYKRPSDEKGEPVTCA